LALDPIYLSLPTVSTRSHMPLSRREIRIKVMQALFAQELSGDTPNHVFEQVLEKEHQALRADSLQNIGRDDAEEDAALMSQLFLGVLQHKNELTELITPKLENWDLSRVAVLDRILLLMGIYEFLHCPSVPVKVTINEYLEIAKEYSTERSNQFLNGVLDKLHHDLQAKGRIVKTGRGLMQAPSSVA